MQPLEGVDLEGHAVARRSPRGVDYHAKEVVSRVAHVTPGLVAERVESVALRHGMIKPSFVLPHSAPNGPVPRELELELIQFHMAQKPVLRGEVGCACFAREVSVERGGMGERGCARRLGGWVWV